MFMDPEKRARRQSLRILISECFMVVAVVITVAILAFVVSGYWVNSDFKVERNGMLQISSLPTGADVIVDGESAWNQRTNTSKVLSSGKHLIELKKDGYDTWSRTINITKGLLYRVHYPRLFPLERQKSAVFEIGATTFATVSPNRELALIANDTTSWTLLGLTGDKITTTPINVSTVFSSVSLAPGAEKGLFVGQIISADWDNNNDRILFKINNGSSVEWSLLNINNPKESINLTKEFNANFSEIKIFDNSASNLLAVLDGDLRKIDTGGRQLSTVLVNDVLSFDYYDSDILFSAKDELNEDYYVGETSLGGEIKTIYDNLKSAPKVAISRFYDDKYISVLNEKNLTIYKKDNNEVFLDEELGFAPDTLTVGHEGEFITLTLGEKIATVDMEAVDVVEWSPNSPYYKWLDSDMLYSINDGELIVYDFDGLNRRPLAKNVSHRFPVTITGDKYLYYVSDENLIRELITI